MILRRVKKFLRKAFLKLAMMLGFLLVVGNLIRMYYPYFGKLGFTLHSLFVRHIIHAKIDGIIGTNFKKPANPKGFYINCDMGSKEAYGRYYMASNKICVQGSVEPSNVNHEYVHYSLWNLGVKDKLLIKGKLNRLINLIKNDLGKIDIKTLRKDDIMFYHIMNNEIKVFAGSESYIFYDWLKKLVPTHWGNEEYITYAVGTILILNDFTKLEFEKYELSNPTLNEIYTLYKDIYSFILYL